MPRSRNTRNMERVSDSTPSSRRNAKVARANGRGANAAFTSGARSANFRDDTVAAQTAAWNENASNRGSNGRYKKKGTGGNIATTTSSMYGRMSTNGRTAGGETHGFSNNTGDGHAQGGLLSRRKRYYQVRVGLGLAGG